MERHIFFHAFWIFVPDTRCSSDLSPHDEKLLIILWAFIRKPSTQNTHIHAFSSVSFSGYMNELRHGSRDWAVDTYRTCIHEKSIYTYSHICQVLSTRYPEYLLRSIILQLIYECFQGVSFGLLCKCASSWYVRRVKNYETDRDQRVALTSS